MMLEQEVMVEKPASEAPCEPSRRAIVLELGVFLHFIQNFLAVVIAPYMK